MKSRAWLNLPIRSEEGKKMSESNMVPLEVSGLSSQGRAEKGSEPEIRMVRWEDSESFCLPDGPIWPSTPKGNKTVPLCGFRQEEIVQKPASEDSSSNCGLKKLQGRKTKNRKNQPLNCGNNNNDIY